MQILTGTEFLCNTVNNGKYCILPIPLQDQVLNNIIFQFSRP